ncbi:MAG: cysteine hydrolase [Actinomycetota bacterium]|nr:cysteine hydrolase [Actinomycetota bacterium]
MPRIATLVIDMLNPYDHEDADALASEAESRIEPLLRLVDATRSHPDAELVYVNDNHGDFTATSADLAERALAGRRPELIEPILPPADTPFLQKVRHSAFYNSALDHMLNENDVEVVVLSGQVTEQCILYTALDAYIRGFEVRVADDAVVPIETELGDAALKMMAHNMQTHLAPSDEVLDA